MNRWHSLLAPSAAERWLNCPRSARLCEDIPEEPSPYAAEGTLAHKVAEHVARYTLFGMTSEEYASQLLILQSDPLYRPEMLEHAHVYAGYLIEVATSHLGPPFRYLEQQIDLSEFVPDGFGTADCLMIGPKIMNIVDYKYGQGVQVSAEENAQLMLYAAGAMGLASWLYVGNATVHQIRLSIVQPRAGGITCWDISRDELMAWVEDFVKPMAQLAYDGRGGFCVGDWCRFCRAKAICRARAQEMLVLPHQGAITETLAPEHIAEALTAGKHLVDWYTALEDYALKKALDGQTIPGYKVVEGVSRRQWSDADAALEAIMAAGHPRELVYDSVPKSLAALEKMIGKKDFEAVAGAYVIKPQGKPALVPDSDKRPPYDPVAAAFGGSQ